MKKQTEGDNEQRRAGARDARDDDRAASEDGVSTGASKQRRKLGSEATHEERLTGGSHGKQAGRSGPDPKPGSTPSVRAGLSDGRTDAFPSRSGEQHASPGDLNDEDQRVLRAVAELEDEDSAPTLVEIADEAGVETDETITALQRLINEHDVVHEILADEGAGPRYEIKART